MSARIRRVAGQHHVGFLLDLCVYSVWPDITLCARLVTGFAILGHIECTPIFRPLLRPSQPLDREVLLEDADDFVRKIQRKLTKHRITEADWKLWEATKKDLKQLFMEHLVDKEDLDRKYGRAKWRAIDDGRASRANSGAGFTAQVHTATVDGVVANVRTFYRRVLQRFGTKHPDDLAMEGSVDDETAAFRYRPTRDDDAPFLIVAVFNPVLRRVQFGEMNVHPFGVGAAVLDYNRQPEVVIHTMRTVLGVCAHHFYDDALILGLNVEKGSA